MGAPMKRVFWLDLARALAIALVVFTHAHERAGIGNDLLKSVFYSVDRLGVPLFFMISGGLVLPKIVDMDILAFYKRRVPQFLVLLFVWTVVTNLVKHWAEGKDLTQALLLSLTRTNGIFPADTGGATQMWFMYAIITLYLVAPFLARLLARLSKAEI